MSRIPFDSLQFSAADLEEFVVRFLSAGISLPVDGPNGVEERVVKYAFRDNKTGGSSDQGVDVIAKMEGGETWGFQCKLKTHGQSQRWTMSESEEVISEATYPADHYFLVVIAPKGQQREAREYIESRGNWTFWDADVLSSLFFTRLREETGIPILEEFFDSETAQHCYGLLTDEVLISENRFFQPLLKETRSFNHLAPIAGSREAVDALHDFVDRGSKKVMLVSGRGGLGKSRMLREFSQEFSEKHPNRILRFVNASARGDTEKSLGYLLKKKLVVVHEDAHRIETLRPTVLAAIASDKDAQLIMTVRPQGVEAVRQALHQFGIGAEEIEPLAVVKSLSQSDMIRLAKSVLGRNPRIEPRVLAGWSDRSPLICVVGGNLIRNQSLDPQDIPNSQIFHVEVFDRFEHQNLESLARDNPEHREFLKRLLRTLAILAPFPAKRESEDILSKFLSIRGSRLETALAELEIAELITKTEKGWRVGPDLFADHLVFRSCFTGDHTSVFLEEIVEAFGKTHFATMLRNLSEAEWRARAENQEMVDLTTTLWNNFESTFRKSSFWDRREMLAVWSTFSVFVPEKSLELATLAMILDEAPEDETAELLSLSISTHRDVVELIPAMLKPIGIYHLDLQFQVFDFLGRLGRNWSPQIEYQPREDDSHPWSAIGKAASFAIDQPMDSVSGVVLWLKSRLTEDWMTELIDRRCGFLSVVLSSIFKRTIERTYREGRSFIFQTIPLSVASTAPMRDAAFQLIERDLIPRSEIVTLNVIPILNETAAFYGVGPDTKANREEWKPVRLHAINLFARCVECWDTVFVKFSVLQSLSSRASFEKDGEIVAAVKKVLAAIPRDLAFQVALVTLGNGEEFQFEDNLDDEQDYEKSWENWKNLSPKVGIALREMYPDESGLFTFLNTFENDARQRGFVPNWGHLLDAIIENENEIGLVWIDRVLKGSDSFLDSHIGLLIQCISDTDDAQQDHLFASALQSSKIDVRASVLRFLSWQKEEVGKETAKLFRKLLSSSDRSAREPALNTLCEAISSGAPWALGFLPVVPVQDLADSEFLKLIDTLTKAIRYERMEVSLAQLSPLLTKLETINQLYSEPFPEFLSILSKLSPITVFDLICKRIERFEKMDQEEEAGSFNPVVKELEPWRIWGLEKENDFPKMAELLITQIRTTANLRVSQYWGNLFQAAVLMNESNLGIDALRNWLVECSDPKELLEIAKLFNIRGTGLVFVYSEFTKEILEKTAREFSAKEKSIRSALLPDPGMRGYSNGELDSEHAWVRDEALKAVAAHSNDPVLGPFFGFVVDRERKDQEWHREDYQNQMLEVGLI